MAVTINGTTGIANDGGYTGDGVVFADTTPANTLVTTTGGNVGVGTSSPAAKLNVVTSGGKSTVAIGDQAASTYSQVLMYGGSGKYNWSIGAQYNLDNAFEITRSTATGGTTFSTPSLAIDSSGNLLVGTTSGTFSQIVSGNGYAFGVSNSTTNNNVLLLAGTSGSTAQNKIVFANGGSVVGTVYTTGSATSYNTSSDYRLKENIAPMTGALAKVAALKPCTYKWKADGSDGEGFIAHELAEVAPQCVTGEKDAVDAEGNPQYQGIDTSFLVATLTAAIQEQQAIITALTARVTALEGA